MLILGVFIPVFKQDKLYKNTNHSSQELLVMITGNIFFMVKSTTVLKNYLKKQDFNLFSLSYLKKKKKKYELLPFRAFCHLFHCVCASQARRRYQKCTCVFVNDGTEAKKTQKDFYFCFLKALNSSFVNLFASTSVEEYTLNILYDLNYFVKLITMKIMVQSYLSLEISPFSCICIICRQ